MDSIEIPQQSNPSKGEIHLMMVNPDPIKEITIPQSLNEHYFIHLSKVFPQSFPDWMEFDEGIFGESCRVHDLCGLNFLK